MVCILQKVRANTQSPASDTEAAAPAYDPLKPLAADVERAVDDGRQELCLGTTVGEYAGVKRSPAQRTPTGGRLRGGAYVKGEGAARPKFPKGKTEGAFPRSDG